MCLFFSLEFSVVCFGLEHFCCMADHAALLSPENLSFTKISITSTSVFFLEDEWTFSIIHLFIEKMVPLPFLIKTDYTTVFNSVLNIFQ